MSGIVYHSALAPELDAGLDPVSEFSTDRVHAFVCDLSGVERLPASFDRCGVIYGEPPFSRVEADVFRERAGFDPDPRWGVLGPLRATEQPLVLIGGANLLSAMPAPDASRSIRYEGPGQRHQGVRARAFAWRLELPEVERTGELIAWLASRFDVIGDPVCGYGRTGAIAVRAGARVVLSDLNPRCIAFIAQRCGGWL